MQSDPLAAERAGRVLATISSLSSDHAANQVAIAKAGGIPPLITWLGTTVGEVQREAAHALLSIVTNNTTTQHLVAKTNGIPALIKCLVNGQLEAQVTSM